ncbi:hypothetical protein, partial [Rudaea sp.]|uniref:hypothetical protein n=1 Tax=Rudaea sp. TaxID=2136325 RepID=UPI00321FB145
MKLADKDGRFLIFVFGRGQICATKKAPSAFNQDGPANEIQLGSILVLMSHSLLRVAPRHLHAI